MQKNVASQKVIIYAYDKTTGTSKTSDSGNLSAQVSKNGGSFASAGGSFGELGFGYYSYAPTQDETNCDLFLLVVVSTTSNIEVEDIVIYTNEHAAAKTSIDSILTDTGTTLYDYLVFLNAGLQLVLEDTGTTLPATLATILEDTGTTLPATLATIDGVCDQTLLDTVALTSSTFADGKSLAEAIQIISAAVAGRISGAGTGTETFLGMDESTTRITITVDSDGNRSDIVYG